MIIKFISISFPRQVSPITYVKHIVKSIQFAHLTDIIRLTAFRVEKHHGEYEFISLDFDGGIELFGVFIQRRPVLRVRVIRKRVLMVITYTVLAFFHCFHGKLVGYFLLLFLPMKMIIMMRMMVMMVIMIVCIHTF